MMSESVTVTVQNGNEAGRGPAIAPLNVSYFSTTPGLCKVAQLVLGIICMACASGGGGGGSWFLFVAITAFILTVLWSLFYLFSLRDVIKLPINWLATELLNTGIYAILYFTAFIAQLVIAYWTTSIVAGIFGIFNTLAYAAGAYFLYLEYKGQ